MTGSHISYTVKGIDNDGKFEGIRRYTDFHILREALITRWPGIYFPPIPPKRSVGNKELKFIEERRYFLERFLRRLANYDFILISEEFKIFSRATGDIKKLMNHLPRLSSFAMLDNYKNNFNIPEEPSSDRLLDCKASIMEFTDYFTKIIPVLEIIKTQVRALIPVIQTRKNDNLEFLRMLEDYEYNDLSFAQKLALQKSIVNSKTCYSIKKKIKDSLGAKSDPFQQLYMWCKGKMYDLYSMEETIQAYKNLEDEKLKNQIKIQQCEEEISRINSGKKSLKNFFKSSSSKQIDILNLKNTIETTERIVTIYKKIISIICVYLAEKAIPEFKKDKMKNYIVGITEIEDSHLNLTFWTSVQNIVTQFGF